MRAPLPSPALLPSWSPPLHPPCLLLLVGASHQFSRSPSSHSPARLLLSLATPPPAPLPPAGLSRGGGAQARSRVPLGRSRWPARSGPVPGPPRSVSRRSAETGGRTRPTTQKCGGRMAQTAMSETYGKSRGFACMCVVGQALGSRNVCDWV